MRLVSIVNIIELDSSIRGLIKTEINSIELMFKNYMLEESKEREALNSKIKDISNKIETVVDKKIETLEASLLELLDDIENLKTQDIKNKEETDKRFIDLEKSFDKKLSDTVQRVDAAILNNGSDFAIKNNETNEKILRLNNELTSLIMSVNQDIHKNIISIAKQCVDDVAEVKYVEKEILGKIKTHIEDKLSLYTEELNQMHYNSISHIIDFNRKSNGNGKIDTSKLDEDLKKKTLQLKWQRDKHDKGEKLLSKGAAIIEKRDRLHEEFLRLEREKKPTDRISVILGVYNEILKDIK